MVNFCAVLGSSNRSSRQNDKGYYRIPAIVSRSNPKKQALNVEHRATWLARIRTEDLAADATEFYEPVSVNIENPATVSKFSISSYFA